MQSTELRWKIHLFLELKEFTVQSLPFCITYSRTCDQLNTGRLTMCPQPTHWVLALSPGIPISTIVFYLTDTFFLPQKHLIEFCYTVAQKYIFEGRYKDAVPAALHSLRFRMNVYGLSSVELVPAYLLLAEASIGKWKWLTRWSP